jgi:DNA-binding transcriptional ArsR family regulator
MPRHATLGPRPADDHGTDHELVRAVLGDQPDDEQISHLADVFALLGDPGRLRLLAALLSRDELCVTDLAAVSGLSESATSHALRLLRAHAVVRARRVGRHVHYSLRDAHVRTLLTTAIDHVTHDRG